MLTKERYMSLLDDIAGYARNANIGPNGINEINEDYNGLKKLIEEHFNPQPLKFEDLKADMWVWNSHFKIFEKIYSINYETKTIRTNDTGFEFIEKEFIENRYYPAQIPWEGDKKQWERTIESYKQ